MSMAQTLFIVELTHFFLIITMSMAHTIYNFVFQTVFSDLTQFLLIVTMSVAQTLSMVATLHQGGGAGGPKSTTKVSLSTSLSPSRSRSRSRCKPSRSRFVEQPQEHDSWKNDDSWPSQPHDGNGNGSWKNDCWPSQPHDGNGNDSWNAGWWAGDRSAQ